MPVAARIVGPVSVELPYEFCRDNVATLPWISSIERTDLAKPISILAATSDRVYALRRWTPRRWAIDHGPTGRGRSDSLAIPQR